MEKLPKNEDRIDKHRVDQIPRYPSMPDHHKAVVDYLNEEIHRAKTLGDIQRQDDLTRLINHVINKGQDQNGST